MTYSALLYMTIDHEKAYTITIVLKKETRS